MNILAKRKDGFHEIQSIFYPVPIYDALEIKHSNETEISFFGDEINGEPKSNLIYKAWDLLFEKHKILPVSISLLKKIPSGGGLGGGSADGAFMLNLLNDFFKLNLSTNKLEEYAAILGSDCPFFIRNKPSIVTGRGENISPIEMSLKGFHLLLVNPKIHISTAEAFQTIIPRHRPKFDILSIQNMDVDYWASQLTNDFEQPILLKYPAIASIKYQMRKLGATYTSLSGTGSTYYGLFKSPPNPKNLFANCDVWQVEI